MQHSVGFQRDEGSTRGTSSLLTLLQQAEPFDVQLKSKAQDWQRTLPPELRFSSWTGGFLGSLEGLIPIARTWLPGAGGSDGCQSPPSDG